jgi:hypothetical protein
MRSNNWKLALAVSVAGLFAISLVHGASAGVGDWDNEDRDLKGTWVVTVQQKNCATNALVGGPFESLLTFNRGGTMTETTSNPLFFPALRGPGHGVWGRIGRSSYNATSLAFITLNGSLTKTQKITQTIELEDPDDFTTTEASVQFYDPAGNLLVTGCAAATGKRFE